MSLEQCLINNIQSKIGSPILGIKKMSGGDISSVHKIETEKNNYVLKSNNSAQALQMFDAERKGLELLNSADKIKTPQIIDVGSKDNSSYILMEYVPARRGNNLDMNNFGQALAELHSKTPKDFGLDHSNFIGSLPQYNLRNNTWSEFYVTQRLLPQIKMATDTGLLKGKYSESKMLDLLNQVAGNVSPSLLHGDLWSGNYLISMNGDPYLIDPAVYYGHNEVDIAMSRLFGGFEQTFYEAYHEILPITDGYYESMDIYQLYYLLVHLNLFGSSYASSVNRILMRYFN